MKTQSLPTYLRRRLSAIRRMVVFSYFNILKLYYQNRRGLLSVKLKWPLGKSVSAADLNPLITVAACTNRSEFLVNIRANFERQSHKRKELIVILHGEHLDERLTRAIFRSLPQVRIFKLSKQESLGNCLNFSTKKSRGRLWAKFDDDDYYGANYLRDATVEFLDPNLSIAGKSHLFCYLERSKKTVLCNWDRVSKHPRYVAGATMVVRREVFKRVQFPDLSLAEDIEFLKKCIGFGYKFRSTHCFNYIYVRRKNPHTHTLVLGEHVFGKEWTVAGGPMNAPLCSL